MLKKVFIFTLFLLFVVGVVDAQESISQQIPSFQHNVEFDIKRPCFDQGFFCSSSFVCNITLIYPDGEILIDNDVMTNQASFSNITVSQSLNNQLGFIRAIQSCNNVTSGGGDTFLIAITGDGKPFEIFPQQFVIIILSFVMICVGLFNDQLRLIKNAGAIIFMIMGVITLYPGYSFINHSTLLGLTLGTALIGLGFYFMINDSFSRNIQEESYDQRPEVESLND